MPLGYQGQNTGGGNGTTGDTRDQGLFLRGETKTQAGEVKENRGGHETGAVGKAAARHRHFRTMGPTMKKSKKADHAHASSEGQSDGERDQQTQDKERRCDALFDSGQGQPGVPAHCADDHRADKGQRHEPPSTSAELKGPETNSNHRQQVIPTTQRMAKPGAETPRQIMAIVTGMGLGKDRKGKKEHSCAKEFTGGFHDRILEE
jgi:hypothetical protein